MAIEPDTRRTPPLDASVADRLLDRGEYAQALEVCDELLARNPHDRAALEYAAFASMRLQRLDQAIARLCSLVDLSPEDGSAWLMLGDVYVLNGQLPLARAAYQQAGRLPGVELEATCGMAEVALGLSDHEGYAQYAAAVMRLPAGGPQSLARRSLIRLRANELREGFAERQAMWSYPTAENATFRQSFADLPWWDGSRLAPGSRLLIHAEDGLGDTIQFVRFVQQASSQAAAPVVLAVAPSLIRLLRRNLPREILVTSLSQARSLAPTVQAPLLALPHLIGTTASSLPPLPYLRPPASGPILPTTHSGTKVKVGLVWTGNPKNLNNRWRSCTVADLQPIIASPAVTAYSLQCGSGASDADGTSIIRLDHLIKDFADTAFLMQQLDAVVSVCSSPAHLAGALGLPTFAMVHTGASWRWGLGTRTPWYDSVQVCRQSVAGEWLTVAQHVASLLGTDTTS